MNARMIKQVCMSVAAVVTLLAPVYSAATPVHAAAADKPLTSLVNDGAGWAKQTIKKPGEKVQFLVTYTNQTDKVQRLVELTDDIGANGMQTVPGSVTFFSPANPNGTEVIPQGPHNGIRAGVLKPNEAFSIQFMASTPARADLKCGDNTFLNTATARLYPAVTEYSASAKVIVRKTCQSSTPTPSPTPTNIPTCDAFTVSDAGGGAGKVTAWHMSRPTGDTKFESVEINWGDGTTSGVHKSARGRSHVYAQNGTYQITATSTYSANGSLSVYCYQTLTISSVAAAQTPQTPQTPTTPSTPTQPVTEDTDTTHTTIVGADNADVDAASASDDEDTTDTADDSADTADSKTLVNTGAGSMVGVFVAAVIAGAVLYQFGIRRLRRN